MTDGDDARKGNAPPRAMGASAFPPEEATQQSPSPRYVQAAAQPEPAPTALGRRVAAIDGELARLIVERATLGHEVGAQRADGVRDAVERLLRRDYPTADGTREVPGSPSQEALEAVFLALDGAWAGRDEATRIAFLGPDGTFTHAAARRVFGESVRFEAAATIARVFELVARGTAQHGVVPIENSTEGSVRDSLDRLLETRLRIEGEVLLKIEHCLLTRAPNLDAVQQVCSHPQALAQCREWLARQLPAARLAAIESTSAAVVLAAEDDGVAAVGSRLAGEIHGVPILSEGIQDQTRNVTRFAVIGHQDIRPTGRDKSSIVFTARHRRGALSRVLDVFDQHGLNLTRIESRPSRDRLWEYVFFVDFEGHQLDPHVARALDRLGEVTGELHLLGSYPRATDEASSCA